MKSFVISTAITTSTLLTTQTFGAPLSICNDKQCTPGESLLNPDTCECVLYKDMPMCIMSMCPNGMNRSPFDCSCPEGDGFVEEFIIVDYERFNKKVMIPKSRSLHSGAYSVVMGAAVILAHLTMISF